MVDIPKLPLVTEVACLVYQYLVVTVFFFRCFCISEFTNESNDFSGCKKLFSTVVFPAWAAFPALEVSPPTKPPAIPAARLANALTVAFRLPSVG